MLIKQPHKMLKLD